MISEGNIFSFNNPQDGAIGRYLPASLKELEDTLRATEISSHPKIKQHPDEIVRASKIIIDPENRIFIGTHYSAAVFLYPPIAYIPQALAIAVTRTIGLPVLYVFYAARLAGLLFFIVSTFFLIKRVRVLKLSLLTLALMPMCIQQGIIISADGFAIAASLAFVVIIINMATCAERRIVSKKEMAILYFMAVILALAKSPSPYILLGFLYYIIPEERFRSKNEYWLHGAGIMLAGMFFVALWWFLNSDVHIAYPVNIPGQINTVLTDPLRFAWRVLDTMFTNSLAKSAFWLGWFDVRLPVIFLFFYYFLMLWPCLDAGQPHPAGARHNIKRGLYIFAVIFVIAVIIHFILYATGQQKPYGKIIGLSGRYFIPVLLPMFFALHLIIPDEFKESCSGLLKINKMLLVKAHLIILAGLLAAATCLIFARYY
jgi:uncharacterized membrane protein